MELMTGLTQRKSIRAFKPEPVTREVAASILEAARWSPSWGNTQPWEFVVVGGEPLKRLTEAMAARFNERVPPNPDVPMPETFPDDYRARYMDCAAGLFSCLGIKREEKDRRFAHMLHMTRAYGAPAIIYVTFKTGLMVPYTMFDLGAITHAICLAALAHGLGSCIEAQLALYPDLVRQYLNLPDICKIAVGIALGYADEGAPANTFRSSREPVEKLVKWLGL